MVWNRMISLPIRWRSAGQKIELKAQDAGVTPKEFVDNVAGEIKNIWDLMNTSYDKFIRTTTWDGVQKDSQGVQ